MCHINVIYRKDRVQSRKLAQYMDFASYMSFKYNNDGEGYIGFTGKNLLKQDRSFFKLRYAPDKFWFLASHQRYKTSGDGIDNVHPHETKDLIIEHNGIFYAMGDKEKSDTKKFAEMLQERYEKLSGKLVDAISELMPEVNGSYSVLVMNKNDRKVYYFKDRATNMYKLEDDKFLIMSTDDDNVGFAKWFFEIEKKVEEVEPYKIYSVLADFKVVGKFKDYIDMPGYGDGYCKSKYGVSYVTGGNRWSDGKDDDWSNYDDCSHTKDVSFSHGLPLADREKPLTSKKDESEGEKAKVTIIDMIEDDG
jgi:hypothetical protein